MAAVWKFDGCGPPFDGLNGPIRLASAKTGLPAQCGLYLITCGNCLAHVGTSKSLRGRVGQLARLGNHRGADEVLCAAACTGASPLVWWEVTASIEVARQREAAFKRHYGEPPYPRMAYASCVSGRALRDRLVQAAGRDSWEAGHIEAIFTIGEKLSLLFQPRFSEIWQEVGPPPGPWGVTPEVQQECIDV